MMGWADDMFDGAVAIAKVMAARRAALREAQRALRNARARARYKLGKTIRKVKPPPPPVDDHDYYESPTSCYCSVTPRPPCGWCESGAGGEDQ